MAEHDGRNRDTEKEVKGDLTRRDLLRKAGLGAAAFTLPGYTNNLLKTKVHGVTKFAGRELAGTLRILQWSHFVPAFDRWFDNVYVKRWGQANDTEVLVDHINQADLPGRVASEAAARRGHDLVALLAPAPQYEDLVINHAPIVQGVRKRRGKMADVCF